MATDIAGLFGLTPQMYEQGIRQSAMNEGAAYARMAPEDRAIAGIYSAGAGLGRAGGGLLGVEDPQLQRITQQDQLLRGLNLRDPQSLEQAAVQATQMGNTPLAMKLFELADAATVRAQQAQTQRQTSLAQLIAQRAYQPGAPESIKT